MKILKLHNLMDTFLCKTILSPDDSRDRDARKIYKTNNILESLDLIGIRIFEKYEFLIRRVVEGAKRLFFEHFL